MVDLKKMHKEVTKIEKDAKDSNADLDNKERVSNREKTEECLRSCKKLY